MQEKFKFDKETLIKIAKGAGIALVGALLTYITEYLSGIDFGEYTPVVVGIWSIAVNAIREFLKGTQQGGENGQAGQDLQ